jgi:hypothetical protein
MPTNGHKYFVIIAGKWSTNIGNAFFNIGASYLLNKSLSNIKTTFLSDQAAYWNLNPMSFRREPVGSLKYNNYINPDYVVLQGSLLTKQFPRVWGESFRHFKRKGIKVLLIGVGQFDYTDTEVEICREFLREYSPFIFISRDRETFNNFKDLSINSFDGLDNAFFLPEVFTPVPHDLPPYIILNFDKTPEPRLTVVRRKELTAAHNEINYQFRNEIWNAKFPSARLKLSEHLGKAFDFIMGPLRLGRTNQQMVGDLLLIRTSHQSNPLMLGRMFRGNNSFCDDIPESYLNLYAQTELTLSDRIHAVLITLAYGKPAMLFSRSGRAKILERVGLTRVTKEPEILDLNRLQEEKEAEMAFLRSIDFGDGVWPRN